MHENYCFKCGAHTLIEDVTKLCTRCYRNWLSGVRYVGLD